MKSIYVVTALKYERRTRNESPMIGFVGTKAYATYEEAVQHMLDEAKAFYEETGYDNNWRENRTGDELYVMKDVGEFRQWNIWVVAAP